MAFVCVRANGGIRGVRIMKSVARGDDFLNDFDFAFVPNLVVETADDGLVGSGHRMRPPPPDRLIRHPRRWARPHRKTGIRGWKGVRLRKAYSEKVWVAIR